MYLNSRMQTPSFFHLSEMMRMHMSNILHMRVLIQRTQLIQIQSQYVDLDHPYVYAEPEQRPGWAQTTLQDAGDLVGDLADTRRTKSNFEEPPIALTSTKPFTSSHIFLVQSSDPRYYGEDNGNPFWESTMQKEYNYLLDNRTWDLVPLPYGRKLVRCRWVYRTKSATDGSISRYKARLVSKGF
jgi:hypothetical protein